MKNVLILGSGRSGTSMLTGSLAKSNYYFGDRSNYLGKNQANPKGFFEDYEVNTINEDILNKYQVNIPEKIRRNFFPACTFYRARWLARISTKKEIYASKSIQQRIKTILVKTAFCYKDPRFSYTLPVWHQVFRSLNIEVKYIVIYREPEKTAQSIVRECSESKALQFLKMNEKMALDIWFKMYSHILKNYQRDENKENWLFIHFEQMFQEDKLNEIENFLSIHIDRNFADKKISRYKSSKTIKSEKLTEVYKELNILSTK